MLLRENDALRIMNAFNYGQIAAVIINITRDKCRKKNYNWQTFFCPAIGHRVAAELNSVCPSFRLPVSRLVTPHVN